MIQNIILGLSALSSITGFSSGTTYEMAESDWSTISTELGMDLTIMDDKVRSNNLILEIRDLYNMSGENQYIEIVLENDGYLIYDKKDNKVLEKSQVEFSDPYKNCFDKFNIYNEDFFNFKYATFDNDSFIDIETNLLINFYDGLSEFVKSESNQAGNYYRLDEIPISNNAIVIENSAYFLKLNNRHAQNIVGTCSIISTEILLGYYDTFYNDLFVSETFDVRSIETTNTSPSINDFSQSPSVDNYEIGDEDFHQYLVSIAKNEIGDDPEVGGMNTLNQIGLVEYYLDIQNLQYTLNTSEGNIGDLISQRAVNIIKNAINLDRPVISNGTQHSTVAFAYDDNYVWVHTGWGWVGATPWSTFQSNAFSNYSAGAIDIIYEGNHIHSDNYYSNNTNKYLCPCGVKFTSTTIIPNNYGFDAQYYNNRKVNTFLIDDFSIQTIRLRTAFVDSYINLSSRKEGAGEAYIEYWFNKPVRSFDFNISYYDASDVLSPLNSTAYFSVLYKNDEGNYYWVHATDLLNDISISTNRYNQNNYSYSYISNEIYGFRFVAKTSATGSVDSGRLCIGNINLIREI